MEIGLQVKKMVKWSNIILTETYKRGTGAWKKEMAKECKLGQPEILMMVIGLKTYELA